jgi:metal-sulfur cluster biosynthetic enzyme
MTPPNLDRIIWQTLNTIADPEIPVVSLVELGNLACSLDSH